MSNFDAVTFAAVKKINMSGGSSSGSSGGTPAVGELMVVPSGFQDPNYSDTGALVDQQAFPALAAKFAPSQHPGVSHAVQTPNIPGAYTLSSINSPYMAYASDTGTIYYSDGYHSHKSVDNGLTWTWVGNTKGLQTISASIVPTNVVYLNGKFYFLVVNSPNLIFTSTDYVTWTLLTSVVLTNATRLFVANNMLFIGVSTATTVVMTSLDGITWTPRVIPSMAVSGVAHNGSMYVISGIGTVVASSPDGSTWTSRTVATACAAVMSRGGIFLVKSYAASATVYTSPDGIVWTARTAPASIPGGTTFCYVSSTSFILTLAAGTTAIYSSPDGITWTTTATPVAWTMFTQLGDISLIMVTPLPYTTYYSTNNWVTSSASGSASVVASVAATWSAFVSNSSIQLIAEAANTNIVYRSSDDGASWLPSTLPNGIKCTSLHFLEAANIFIAMCTGNSAYATSTDGGATWVQHALPTSASYTILLDRNSTDRVALAATTAALGFIYTTDGVTWNTMFAGSAYTVSNLATFKGNRGVFVNGNQGISVGAFPSGSPDVYNSAVGNPSISTPSAALTNFNQVGKLAASSTSIVLFPLTYTTSPGSTALVSHSGFDWAVVTLPFSSMGWSDVVYTGSYFIALMTNTSLPLTVAAISVDGMQWDLCDLGQNLPANVSVIGSPVIYSNKFGTYLYIPGFANLMKIGNSASAVKVPFIAPPSTTTKYVVRGK